jgi:hypothetical protein
MIRNLKVLIAAAMALAAFGAVSASGAQAAAHFHCSTKPCTATLKPDGEAGTKTAHHVFIVKKGTASGSFTCNSLSGTATLAAEEVTEATFSSLAYSTCNIAGTAVTVNMNGCTYTFTAAGGVTVGGCTSGKEIELVVGGASGCIITIGAQTLSGVSYHNIGVEASNTTEITAEVLVKSIKGKTNGKCTSVTGFDGEFTEAEYTTGNTLVTGETSAGVMKNAWWTSV